MKMTLEKSGWVMILEDVTGPEVGTMLASIESSTSQGFKEAVERMFLQQNALITKNIKPKRAYHKKTMAMDLPSGTDVFVILKRNPEAMKLTPKEFFNKYVSSDVLPEKEYARLAARFYYARKKVEKSNSDIDTIEMKVV